MSNTTSTIPENIKTARTAIASANTVRGRVSEPGSGVRQRALRKRTFLSSSNLSDPVLASQLPAAGETNEAAPRPQLVKKVVRVEDAPDLHAAMVRRLILDGTPITNARTMADIAMAIEEGRARRSRRGRKRLPPRLYLRKGRGRDTNDAIGIRDGSHRELTGFEPREGEDYREHEGARQRLLEYVEKRVRAILGRALKKDVTVSAAFVEFLDNHRPGGGTHSLDVARINEIENHLLQLEEFMGSDSLADLGINTAGQYVDFRVTQQIKSQSKANPRPTKEVRLVTRRTAADHTDTLMLVLNWYCQQHGIEMIKMHKPKVRSSGVVWLTWEEVVRLLLAARGTIFDENGKRKGRHQRRARYECVVRFIIVYVYGGTRHQNILQLLWGKHSHLGHIDPNTGIIERQGDKADVTFKRRGTSFIYGSLASLAKKWEAQDREAGRNSPHCFKRVIHDEKGRPMGNKKGRPNRRLAIRFNEVAKLAGLPHAKPHMLKHTGVTLFAKCGMPPADISIAFSTSVLTLLTRYTHLRPYFASVMPFRQENLRLLRLRRFSPRASNDRDC